MLAPFVMTQNLPGEGRVGEGISRNEIVPLYLGASKMNTTEFSAFTAFMKCVCWGAVGGKGMENVVSLEFCVSQAHTFTCAVSLGSHTPFHLQCMNSRLSSQ